MRVLAALALAGVALTARAEEARWYLEHDNDVFWGTDRWYTSGVRIGRVKEGVEWGLLQEIYTPDAKHFVDGRVDRAPVGRLFLVYAKHSHEPGVFQTLELDLGVRGPSAAGRQTTQEVHHIVPAPFVDWSRQLGDSFDGQAVFVRTQSVLPSMKVNWGGVLGNQVTFAHTGVEFRTGANRALASPLLRFAATPPFDDAGEFGWSAFAGASVRWVARNRLLTRNYDPFGPDLTHERLVVRGSAGVAWVRPWGALDFSLAMDSREFEDQHAPHRFGSISVHVPF